MSITIHNGSPPVPPAPEPASVFERVCRDAPRFHQFGGEAVSWSNGNPGIIEAYLEPGMRTLETGSGYSTVVFAGRGCDHVAVTPEAIEAERISAYCRDVGYAVPDFLIGSSAEILPKLTEGELDAVLIDGAHAFPYPIVDWFYANRLLAPGGLVFVDDTDLSPCFLLARYLTVDPHWELVREEPGLAVFRKLGDHDFPHDYWSAQPFARTRVTDLESFLRCVWPEQLPALRAAGGRSPLLEPAILQESPPWGGVQLPYCDIPGMITEEERRYYHWIADYYTGAGEVVELGPWLGCSTWHIATALRRNPAFEGRRLTVVDDFVWRASWMDGYYDWPDRPADHEDFQHIFAAYVHSVAGHLDVQRARIAEYDGNGWLPQLAWDGRPVEILYVDCGRTYDANQAWWEMLEPSLIPGRSLVVMQDWQLHKEEPPQWYNQTKEFTDSKGDALELVHELAHGDIGAFLYRGDGR